MTGDSEELRGQLAAAVSDLEHDHTAAAGPGGAVAVLDRPTAPADPESGNARAGHTQARKVISSVGRVAGRAAVKIGSIPSTSVATTGRGVLLAAKVMRYAVTDTFTLRLPFG